MITRSVVRPVLRNVCGSPLDWRGAGYPSSLALLWPLKLTAAGILKSAKGPAPTFADAPTVTADGVTPGAGPSFGTLTRGNGKVFAYKIKMTIASADVSSEMHVLGPLYLRQGLLVAKVGETEATHVHSWANGDAVYAKVAVTPSGLTVGDF